MRNLAGQQFSIAGPQAIFPLKHLNFAISQAGGESSGPSAACSPIQSLQNEGDMRKKNNQMRNGLSAPNFDDQCALLWIYR